MTAFDRLVERLDGVRGRGSTAMARCPAHDDRNPSLSVRREADRVLIYCHAGCSTDEVLEALGLVARDLYDETREARRPDDRWLPRDLEWGESYEYCSADGVLAFEVIRARKPGGGKAFLQRRPDAGSRSGWAWSVRDLRPEQRGIPYRLPEVQQAIAAGETIWIAEGEKDVEALRSAGVTATCNAGGAGKWSSTHAEHLRGARVIITRDRDKPGAAHQQQVARSLEGIAMSVRLVEPAEGKDAADHLSAGRSLDDFVPVEGAEGDEEQTAGEATSAGAGGSSGTWYEARENGLYLLREREGRDGESEITATRLTNFTAHIVASTEVDDGAEVQRRLDIKATVAGRTRMASVTASEFSRMEWVIPELGPAAVVEAGRGIRDHARAAIQAVSDPAEVRVMGQIGWRQIDGEWVCLHAGGAIGAHGPVEGVEVNLHGTLTGYTLPKPGGVEDVQASLSILDVAPDRITLPLLAAVVRAPLGGVDMAVGLHGQTGIGKSELAALAQQHYGSAMNARSLPASWSPTANSLEEQAFLAADALLTVDDFVASGSPPDADRLHGAADRLIRGAGNGAGRGRMAKDGTLRAARPARGMILVTSEEVPRGQSLRARMMTLEVRPGDVNWQSLSGAQQHAAGGTYAAALASYLRWLAPHLDDVHGRRGEEIAALRGQVSALHRRTATGIASLAWGWKVWLEFAIEVGAITDEQRDRLWQRGWTALLAAAEAANVAVGETDPAQRFLVLLGSAVSSGRAHVAARDGGCPPSEPGAWGWRSRDGVMTDMGARIGWTEGTDLWLDPEAAYTAAKTAGEGLSIDLETLRSRLSDGGLLQSHEPSGKTGVRVRLQGRQRRVLHLSADALGEAAEVRHRGVSGVAQDDSGRDTVRHHRDTGVSQREMPSDQGEYLLHPGETPETPWGEHVTQVSGDFGPLEGLEGPETGSTGAYTPHTVPSVSRVTHLLGGAWG